MTFCFIVLQSSPATNVGPQKQVSCVSLSRGSNYSDNWGWDTWLSGACNWLQGLVLAAASDAFWCCMVAPGGFLSASSASQSCPKPLCRRDMLGWPWIPILVFTVTLLFFIPVILGVQQWTRGRVESVDSAWNPLQAEPCFPVSTGGEWRVGGTQSHLMTLYSSIFIEL